METHLEAHLKAYQDYLDLVLQHAAALLVALPSPPPYVAMSPGPSPLPAPTVRQDQPRKWWRFEPILEPIPE